MLRGRFNKTLSHTISKTICNYTISLEVGTVLKLPKLWQIPFAKKDFFSILKCTNVDEIDPRCQFHQHFLFESSFLVPKFCTKLAFRVEILAPKILYEKRALKMLMKLTVDVMEMEVGKIHRKVSSLLNSCKLS